MPSRRSRLCVVKRPEAALQVCALLLFFLSGVTLAYGATPLSELYEQTLHYIYEGNGLWNPLLHERLPRLIVLVFTGASLAVAGAVMQALFQNPLATPSILGITFGGSFCVFFAFLFGWHHSFPQGISLAAFIGCLSTLLLVYGLARRQFLHSSAGLILCGIAVTTVLMAIQSTLLYIWRDQWEFIQLITEWGAGSTLDRSWQHVHMQLPLAFTGLYGCWYYSQELNLLALGEEEALNLGVDVAQVRWRLLLCVALLTAGALAAVGIVAYFGLLLPHIFRRLYGPNNQILVPLCAIGGSTLFLLLDVCLRLNHIYWLSIGNISAILGGLFFLFLLIKESPTYARS